MKFRSLFKKSGVLLLFLAALAVNAAAQKPVSQTPRQEKLLNGLKLLMWSDPNATDVRISIRVHSGSAFDPQGKEGVMKLLAENLFPTAASREYFATDLDGNLDINSNYDYIQINASAKSSEFLTLLESLAQAVSTPTIDKETTAALIKSLSDQVVALEENPAYVAEMAATRRLFGTFPYGRPQMGTIESLQRIDFADLLFAKERFLTADNATVAISGNFNGDLGFRAARRYFGAWLKADKKIPYTFRQPEDPDTKPLEIAINNAVAGSAFALRGLARNDPDYVPSLVLEHVLRARAAKKGAGVTVEHDARILPGVVTVSVAGSTAFPFALFGDRITEGEFSAARTQAAAEFAKRSIVDQWLDADTYRTPVLGDATAFQKVTIADVQRVADRLARNPIAAVVVKATPPGSN